MVSSAGYLAGKYFAIQTSLLEENLALIIIVFAAIGLVMGYTMKYIVDRSVAETTLAAKE
jgi:hypothetical protein